MSLNVCIIGCGARGTDHARTWKHRSDTSVISVFDVDAARRQSLAAEVGAIACGSFEKAILHDGVDVVSVCVPTAYHCEVTCCAAEHGRHVFSEKPLALDLEQGRKMLAAVESAGVQFMPCFQLRDRSPYPRQRELFASGALGSPVRLRFTDIREVRPKQAMHIRTLNGGVVIDMACHMVDMLRYITGEEPTRVHASGHIFGQGKQRLSGVEDLAVDEANIDVSFTGGHQLQLYLNWGMPEQITAYSEQMLIGPNGMARNAGGDCEVLYGDHTESWPGPSPGTAVRIDRLVDAITGRVPADVDGKDALVALKVSLAALQSVDTGEVVTLEISE
jgi:predicted dehydrogenase